MLSLLLLALSGGASDAAVAGPLHAAPPAESRCDTNCAGRPADVVEASTGIATLGEASRIDRSLARLNALRTASGAQALDRSEVLFASASHHAAYLSRNGFRSAPSVHAETAGLVEFTGVNPFVRMREGGYRPSYATEVVGDLGSTATDSDCVEHLMRTVYHAALLLSRVTEVGMAYGSANAAGTCVIDLGVPLPTPTTEGPRQIVRYPWPGMTLSTGSLRLDSEIPRPAPRQLPDSSVGISVLVGLRDAGPAVTGAGTPAIQIQDFQLRDAMDAPVSCVILADPVVSGPGIVPDVSLHGSFVALIPRKPLPAGHYRVLLHATIGADPIAPPPWTFVVAPSGTPIGPDQVGSARLPTTRHLATWLTSAAAQD